MIKSKSDFKNYLEKDYISLGLKKRKIRIIDWIFPDPIWTFQKSLRRLEYYTNVPSMWHKLLRIVESIRFRRISLKLGFSIPINVFGPGLSIAHYGTIIVNPNCKVGSFCRLHACVNIGASSGQTEAPQIGNNVYIGPGALIFGNIKIADDITIGANATVNKSFEEKKCILAGVPASVVKKNSDNWVIFNRVHI